MKKIFIVSITAFTLTAISLLGAPYWFLLVASIQQPSNLMPPEMERVSQLGNTLTQAGIVFATLSILTGMGVLLSKPQAPSSLPAKPRWHVLSDMGLVLVVMLPVSFALSFVYMKIPTLAWVLFWIPWTAGYLAMCVKRQTVDFLHLARVALAVIILMMTLEIFIKTVDWPGEFPIGPLIKQLLSGSVGQAISVVIAGWGYRWMIAIKLQNINRE